MRARGASLGWTVWGAIIVGWSLFPVLWMLSLSPKSPIGFREGKPGFLPDAWSWSNYQSVFADHLFVSALRNSFGIAIIATVLALIVATLAAYAIARLQFPGKKLILSMALAIAMFPQAALVGPLFDVWRLIEIYDTWLGLVIPYLTFALPLSIWTLSALRFRGRWSRPHK